MEIIWMSHSGFVSLELPNQNDVNDCQIRYFIPIQILAYVK